MTGILRFQKLLLALLLSAALHVVLLGLFSSDGVVPDFFDLTASSSQYQAVLMGSVSAPAKPVDASSSPPVARPQPARPRESRRLPQPAQTTASDLPTIEAPVAPSASVNLADTTEWEKTAVATNINVPSIVLPSTQPGSEIRSDASIVRVENTGDVTAFPTRIDMTYQMTSSVTNGIAHFSWKRDANQYELTSSIRATGLIASLLVGRIIQQSKGEITVSGLRPLFFSLQRGKAPADTASFDYERRELTLLKHGETHVLPLQDGLQDTQTLLFAMAQQFQRLRRPDGNTGANERLAVRVTNARKVYDYVFLAVGNEPMEINGVSIDTLHLRRETQDPEDAHELWLSAQHYNLPVRMKFNIGRIAVEQRLTQMSVDVP